MLNNGTAVNGDTFWDSVFGKQCAEGEEEFFKLFADCQTPVSLFLKLWFILGMFVIIQGCWTSICFGSCWLWGVRSVTSPTACSYICMAWVIVPCFFIISDVFLTATTSFMMNHPVYFCLCAVYVVYVGLLSGCRALWGEDRESASRGEDQGSVSRSDRRWRCGGWLIMLRARHNRAKTWRRRVAVIIEDLEGPTSRLLQADWRGSTSRTSLPPSFRRYTDHISGEFRHPEASDSREQFEELVAWISCIEVEGVFRLVVEYL